MPDQVKLESNDKKEIIVDVAIARMSDTLAHMLDTMDEATIADKPIPIPHVNAEVLGRVVEWCKHHRDDPSPKEEVYDGRPVDLNVPEWDQKFLQLSEDVQKPFLDLMKAANFLHIPGLLLNCSKVVANKISNKTADEIRSYFHVENDFTEAEIKKIREDQAWY